METTLTPDLFNETSDLFNETSDDLDDEAEDPLKVAERWIRLIGIPILLILGTAGNALVIIILTVRRLKPHPTSVLLAFLALYDTMVLWTGFFRMFYKTVYKADFRINSDAMCKWHTQLTYFSTSVSVWTLVLVTTQRLIAVYIPLKAKTVLTMKRTCISLFIMTIFFFFFNAHLFFTVAQVVEDGVVYCSYADGFYHFANNVWPKMDLITNSIIPFIILLFCNCTIIYKARTGSKLLSKDKDNKSSSSKANTAMTVMLISVNIIFLVTTAPFALYNTDAFKAWVVAYTPKDDLLFTTLYIVQGINNASNFYIYCLSGQKFREEMKIMFMYGTKNPPRNQNFGRSTVTTSRATSNTDSSVVVKSAVNGDQKTSLANDQKSKVISSNGTGQNDKDGIINQACNADDETRL